MIMLAVQIFLLLLAAYIAGCMVGCMLRRALHTPKRLAPVMAAPIEQAEAAAVPHRSASSESSRFESALTGRIPVQQPADRSGEPVIEVRPSLSPEPDRATAAPPVTEIEAVEGIAISERSTPSEPQPPAEEAEPVVAPPPAPPATAIEDIVEDVAPPPPPPPPSIGQFGSYAAVAAAAASAHALKEVETKSDAHVDEPDASDWVAADTVSQAISESSAGGVAPTPVETLSVPVEEPPWQPQDEAVSSDDLKRIRAIDRDLEQRLNEAGVRRYSDIANWTASDVARISQTLSLADRIEQENWIEQAQILARGADRDQPGGRAGAEIAPVMGMAAAAANAAASVAARQSAAPDRFTRIIGIDQETEQALYNMGYSRYAEIAQWTSDDIAIVEDLLGRPGRVGLDNWIEQARVLARYAGEPAAPRPVRLADAIRENKSKSNPQDTARSDVAGLRSVRSQALRGELPASGDRIDDLKRIRGIGVLIEKRLNALGITSYEQVANWTKADIDSVSSQLDFRGRIERENWIEQARILASGGQTEFSRRVDRGEVESSKDN